MRLHESAYVMLLLLLAACSAPATLVPPPATLPPVPIAVPQPTVTERPPTATATLVIQDSSPHVAQGTAAPYRRFPALAQDRIGLWADATSLPFNPKVPPAAQLDTFLGPRALQIRQQMPTAIAMMYVDATKPEQAIAKAQEAIGPYDAVLVDARVISGTTALAGTDKLLTTLKGVAGTRPFYASTYAWSNGKAYAQYTKDAQALLPKVDGICICDFVRSQDDKYDGYRSMPDWKQDIDALDQLSRGSEKIVLVATRFGSAVTKGGGTFDEWFNYALASFLLGANGPRTYFSFQGAGLDNYMVSNLLTIKLGAPYGSYSFSYNMFSRQFAKGLVLVNPGKDKTSMPLGRPYLNSLGQQVTRADLPPHTGMILSVVR